MKCFLALSLFFLTAHANTNANGDANANQRVRRSKQTIVGGKSVAARPWFGLYDYDPDGVRVFCGVTLIHPDIALTAAQCAINDYDGNARLRFNSTFWKKGGTVVSTTKAIGHPDYGNTPLGQGGDVAILVLSESLSLDTVTLNSDPSIPAAGDQLFGIGFGDVDTDGNLPDNLQGAYMKAYGSCPFCLGDIFTPVNDDNVICAEAGETTSCFGDGGIPWLTGEDSSVQVGINSFFTVLPLPFCQECTQAIRVGFTRVSAYYDWIQGQICANSANPPSTCTAAQLEGQVTQSKSSAAETGFIDQLSKKIGDQFVGSRSTPYPEL